MQKLRFVARRIWAWHFYVVFIGLFLWFYPLFYIILKDEKQYARANRLRRRWAKWLLRLCGVSWNINYQFRPEEGKNYIICANHTSILDIPLMALLFEGEYRFMAKHELKQLPLFGIFFSTIDIPVDRESRLGSFKAFKQGMEALQKGHSIIVFPEGTTSDGLAPDMLDFKNGPFRMAIDAGVDIIPVTFLDNWHLFLYDGSMQFKPGRTRAIIHSPVKTAGLSKKDAEQLKDETFYIIYDTLKEEYEGRYRFSR